MTLQHDRLRIILSSGLIGLMVFSSVFTLLVPQVFAADTISTSTYLDKDDDGTVDTIRWVFDENVTACAYEAGDWTVDTASEMNLIITGLTCTGSDVNLDIDITADAGETSATTDPVVSYDNVGTVGSVTLTGGAAAAHASITATDEAAPVVTSISYENISGTAGFINRIHFYLSETIEASSTFAEQNFIITNDGDFNGLASDATSQDLVTTTRTSIPVLFNTSASTISDTFDDSGLFAVSLTGTFNFDDAAGNSHTQAEITGAQTQATIVDEAEPVIEFLSYFDNDGDGKIDRVQLSFSEAIVANSFISKSTLLFDNVGDFTGMDFGSDATDLITSSGVTGLLIDLGTEATVVDTKDDSGLIDLADTGAYAIEDAAGNSNNFINGSTSAVTYVDQAPPVIASISPPDLGSGDKASNIVITFSESMDPVFVEATEFTVSPDPGAFTTTFSASDHTVTLDSDTDFVCDQVYTVTTTEANINASSGTGSTVLLTTGPEDGDWTFTATCSSGSSSPTTPLPTYETLLLAPNGGETLTIGESTDITWSTGGTGTLNFVDLLLSTDGGSIYSAIAEGEVNDGTYTWTVPSSVTTQARVRVEAHNNLSPLATDDSDIDFAIVAASTSTPTVETPSDVSEPTAGTTGPSPVTGLMEEISVVSPGDLVRSPFFDTVYYIDNDLVRHPFFNETIYATWYDDFNAVKVVTDATLPTLSIGTNILPKPGVAWVKIQSTNKVYLVETNPLDEFKPTLRWISSEPLAEELLGTNWADYVIDLDVSLFGRFNFGTDVLNSSEATIDLNMMKKRVELSV